MLSPNRSKYRAVSLPDQASLWFHVSTILERRIRHSRQGQLKMVCTEPINSPTVNNIQKTYKTAAVPFQVSPEVTRQVWFQLLWEKVVVLLFVNDNASAEFRQVSGPLSVFPPKAWEFRACVIQQPCKSMLGKETPWQQFEAKAEKLNKTRPKNCAQNKKQWSMQLWVRCPSSRSKRSSRVRNLSGVGVGAWGRGAWEGAWGQGTWGRGLCGVRAWVDRPCQYRTPTRCSALKGHRTIGELCRKSQVTRFGIYISFSCLCERVVHCTIFFYERNVCRPVSCLTGHCFGTVLIIH